jgi:hypothetical protein
VLTLRQGADPATMVSSAGGIGTTDDSRIRPPVTETTATTRPARASPPPVRRQSGPTVQATVPPGIIDERYSGTLDYREAEPGEAATVVPDDACSLLDFASSPGSGILVPFAIAECLAVWALHLRHLARRATTSSSPPVSEDTR